MFAMFIVYNGPILDYFYYLLTWQQQLRIGTQESLTCDVSHVDIWSRHKNKVFINVKRTTLFSLDTLVNHLCLPLQVDHISCILDRGHWVERNDYHLRIIYHCKAVMTMYISQCCGSKELNPRGLYILECNLTDGPSWNNSSIICLVWNASK